MNDPITESSETASDITKQLRSRDMNWEDLYNPVQTEGRTRSLTDRENQIAMSESSRLGPCLITATLVIPQL